MPFVEGRSRRYYQSRYAAIVIHRRCEIGFVDVIQFGNGGFLIIIDVVRIIVQLHVLIGLQRRQQKAAEDQQQKEKQQQDHEHFAQYRQQQQRQQQEQE